MNLRTLALTTVACLAAFTASAYDLGTKYPARLNVGDAHPTNYGSQLWYSSDTGGTTTTSNLISDTTYYIPMHLAKPTAIDQVAVRVTSGGNNQLKMGIVTADPTTCAPTTTITSNTAGTNIGTTGPRAATMDATPVLPAGEYYVAVIVSASAAITVAGRSTGAGTSWAWRCGQASGTDILFSGTNNPMGYISANGATPYTSGISSTHAGATVRVTSNHPGAAFRVR